MRSLRKILKRRQRELFAVSMMVPFRRRPWTGLQVHTGSGGWYWHYPLPMTRRGAQRKPAPTWRTDQTEYKIVTVTSHSGACRHRAKAREVAARTR